MKSCNLQLPRAIKKSSGYKKEARKPNRTRQRTSNNKQRTQGKSGRKNAPTLESQFTFSFLLFCVFFAHLSLPLSLAIFLAHSRLPSAEFMRCVLHYFDFLQFRAKRTRTFIFLYGRKKIVQIFFLLSQFYDTTSSRSENMIFLAIMTSCKP